MYHIRSELKSLLDLTAMFKRVAEFLVVSTLVYAGSPTLDLHWGDLNRLLPGKSVIVDLDDSSGIRPPLLPWKPRRSP